MSDYEPDEEWMNAALGKDGCESCKQLQADKERLKEYITKHLIETCPDAYCDGSVDKCKKCGEKWIKGILKSGEK